MLLSLLFFRSVSRTITILRKKKVYFGHPRHCQKKAGYNIWAPVDKLYIIIIIIIIIINCFTGLKSLECTHNK